MLPRHLLADVAGLTRILDAHLASELEPLAAGDARTARAAILDAFLLAAAVDQASEDYLHRDRWSLGTVVAAGRRLARGRSGTAPAAVRAAVALRALATDARARQAPERALVAWREELARYVQRLSDTVVALQSSGESTAEHLGALVEDGQTLLGRAAGVLPEALLASIMRRSPCFAIFDQRPEDVGRLVDAFARRRPDRERQLVVVGIRTSGSYLGPLCVSYLAQRGYRHIDLLTYRPEQPWLPHERDRLAELVTADPLVLVIDDPPRTGTQMALAARELQAFGVPQDAIVLLLQLLGPETSLPARLEPYQAELLPWGRWSIHERLGERAAREALDALLRGRPLGGADDGVVEEVEGVERLDAGPGERLPARGHAHAVFRARCRVAGREEPVEHTVYARGVGIGWIGGAALAACSAAAEFRPAQHGVHEGVLYRDWLPDAASLARRPTREGAAIAARVASYVARRSDVLAVPADPSRRLRGRGTAWEWAGSLLANAFGRAGPALKPVTEQLALRLLRPARPSVLDGNTALPFWFADPEGAVEDAVKVDSVRRAALAHYSVDPVLDLAGAAADYASRSGDEAAAAQFADALRAEYEHATGETVGEERWLLYVLVHLFHRHRAVAGDAGAQVAEPQHAPVVDSLGVERVAARFHRAYVERLFFADLEVPTAGPLCAIDIDWVLETRWLGFPAIGPAGAQALRSLTRHGYRPVVASGRSLEEVRARCRAYRLAGGVGEYGAAVYDHASGRSRTLLTAAEQDGLERLRSALVALPGVRLEPGREASIRAYRTGPDGIRSGLGADEIAGALRSAGVEGRVRGMGARTQTDFAVGRVDKGVGVWALAELLGPDGEPRPRPLLALAVGDSIHDVPVLALAERPFAPANAGAELRRAIAEGRARVDLLDREAQAGLLQAVAAVLGHRPERCRTCAPPPFGAETRLLLAALAALNGGARERIRAAARLGRTLVAAPSASRVGPASSGPLDSVKASPAPSA